MVYILPKDLLSKDALLVLAFGELSVLELSAVLTKYLKGIKQLCENVAIVEFSVPYAGEIRKIAGIHKFASPIFTSTTYNERIIHKILEILTSKEEVKRLSVSAYCGVDEQDYESIVRCVLHAARELGLHGIKLVRSSRFELLAEQIISRDILDIIAVRYGKNHYLGPTAYVPDVNEFKSRAINKPVRSAEISISPRLARVLINISGASRGDTLLDPFCGSGTIVAESILASINCIGIDKDTRRIDETERNLKWITSGKSVTNLGKYELMVGDARELHKILRGRKVDAIVTEPILIPKLTSRPTLSDARRMIDKAAKIYSTALSSMTSVLSNKGRIVITTPLIYTAEGKEIYLDLEYARDLGLGYFQPANISFHYPIILSSQSTRWLKRTVYVFTKTD